MPILATGGFAVAHNGNISNAMTVRRDLVRRGSIFQSTSDTEVIIHLVATSGYRTLLDRLIDALKRVEGAYSLICLTTEGMIACRDPLGIRPLVMGKLGDSVIFASETVALDIVGAEFIRSVEPGELVVVRGSEITSHKPFIPVPRRARAFSSMSISRDPIRLSRASASIRSARRLARNSRAKMASMSIMSFRCPTAARLRPSAMPRPQEFRSSSASSAHIMSAGPSSSRATASAIWA